MIRFLHVSKRYPNGIEALRDITLDIKEGEFLFISGASGAGKTTFIRLLLFIEKATSGDIILFGRNVMAMQKKSIPFLRRNIGVVFQDFKLIESRTVFDNVALVLNIFGLSSREIRRRVNNALESVGLETYINSYPLMLSGGEQQRVAIARALVMEPAMLLADEPTGNLDPELSLTIMELFKKINSKGTTVLIATHDREMLKIQKKRTILLNKGFLIEDKIFDEF
jgi:cell division transport system ATP-binding protein